MKCVLNELNGKYRGTVIQIVDDQGDYELTVWITPDSENKLSLIPSQREIDSYGVYGEHSHFTVDDWVNNVIVTQDDIFGNDVQTPIQDIINFNGAHFESQASYKKAMELISKLEA